jgi:hypothetical protein
MEIGSWEGRSTIHLARLLHPRILLAVDTWDGSYAEGPNHVTVVEAKRRDVFGTFCSNLLAAGVGNVVPIRMNCFRFLEVFKGLVSFCHVDAAHDYDSVKRTLEALKQRMTSGAVFCGDDFMTAHAGRVDLDGGVERAVRETLEYPVQYGNVWAWFNKG